VRAACAALLVADNRVVLTYVPAAGATGEGSDEAGDDGDGGPGGPLEDGETEVRA
jgi:hypothetical protein